MWRDVMTAAVVAMAVGAGALSAPISPWAPPFANAPDFVLSLTQNAHDNEGWTIAHHGRWTRIASKSGAAYFFNHQDPTSVLVVRDGAQRITALGIWKKIHDLPSAEVGLPDLADEVRAVWQAGAELLRGRLDVSPCIGADAIAASYLPATRDSRQTVTARGRLECSVVADADVAPARDLLDWPAWAIVADMRGDKASGNPAGMMVEIDDTTQLLRYPWRAERLTTQSWQQTTIKHLPSDGTITYSRDPSGTLYRLTLAVDAGEPPVPLNDGAPYPPETIHGQQCSWFDIRPGIRDAGSIACLTADGVMLRREDSSMGAPEPMIEASRIEEREISIDEIFPPDIFNRAAWGLPE